MKNIVNNLTKKVKIDSNFAIFFCAVVFGFSYSVYLLGDRINPFNIEWLFNRVDPASHFIGWLYFSQDVWSWPITFSQSLAYPTGANISYSDSIPLWAVIFKCFAHLFPSRIQYFGCFIVFNFIMQFFWGAKLSILFKKDSLFLAILSGLLFMLAPPLTWRLHGHFALTSHWLILAAIWCYYQLKLSENIKKILAIQIILIVIASGIHPYLATMVLALVITGQFQLFILKNISLGKTFLYCFLSILTLIVSWYFWGYLPADTYQRDVLSYGDYSLDLLGVINPQYSSMFLKTTVPFRVGDFEGFNYLGLGIILLIFTNIFRLFTKINKQQINLKLFTKSLSQDWPLIFLSLYLIIFSLTNKVIWGNKIVLEYPLPTIVSNLFETFRASGRFFWPVHYLIILGIIVSTSKIWKSQQAKLLLTLIVLIQFLDLRPLHSGSTLWMKSQPPNILTSEVWRNLHKEYNQLIILPSHQCGNTPAPFPILEKIAVLQGLKTNSAYLGRYSPEQLQVHCENLLDILSSGHLDKDAAYILGRQFFDEARKINKEQHNSHYCSLVDGYILCHQRNTSLAINKNAVPSYSLSRILYFNSQANNSWEYQFGGWSQPEENGTWTDGNEAHLVMQIKQPIKDDLILEASVTPYLNEKHPEQLVDISVNGQLVSQWMFQFDTRRGARLTREAIIPAKFINPNSPLYLTFHIHNPASPYSLGLNEDKRLLGLHFQSLQLYSE